jgi:hypothetical protein
MREDACHERAATERHGYRMAMTVGFESPQFSRRQRRLDVKGDTGCALQPHSVQSVDQAGHTPDFIVFWVARDDQQLTDAGTVWFSLERRPVTPLQ